MSEKEQIERIRSLLGDPEALFQYLAGLSRPLGPFVREYIASQVGVIGEIGEVRLQYRVRREDGRYATDEQATYSNGRPCHGINFNEIGRTWPSVKSLMRALKSRPQLYQGCTVVTEYAVTLVAHVCEDKCGDPKALKTKLMEKEVQRSSRPITRIPNKDLKVGTVYRTKSGKTGLFRGWTRWYGASSGHFKAAMVFSFFHKSEKEVIFQNQYNPGRWEVQGSHSFVEDVGQVDVAKEHLPVFPTAKEVDLSTHGAQPISRLRSW